MLKFGADPMFQPPMPAPPAASRPEVPKVMAPSAAPAPVVKPIDSKSFLNPLGAAEDAWGQAKKQFNSPQVQSALAAGATDNKPPLSYLTQHLPESWQEPVNSALGFVQKGLKHVGPQGFAGLMGGVAPGLMKGLLSTPIGLPGVVAAHAALRGGESFAAAKNFFNPLLQKAGLT